MNEIDRKGRKRKWYHRWAMWVIFTQREKKVSEKLYSFHTFKFAAKNAASVQNDPSVLAHTVEGMAEGKPGVFVDCEVRRAR